MKLRLFVSVIFFFYAFSSLAIFGFKNKKKNKNDDKKTFAIRSTAATLSGQIDEIDKILESDEDYDFTKLKSDKALFTRAIKTAKKLSDLIYLRYEKPKNNKREKLRKKTKLGKLHISQGLKLPSLKTNKFKKISILVPVSIIRMWDKEVTYKKEQKEGMPLDRCSCFLAPISIPLDLLGYAVQLFNHNNWDTNDAKWPKIEKESAEYCLNKDVIREWQGEFKSLLDAAEKRLVELENGKEKLKSQVNRYKYFNNSVYPTAPIILQD